MSLELILLYVDDLHRDNEDMNNNTRSVESLLKRDKQKAERDLKRVERDCLVKGWISPEIRNTSNDTHQGLEVGSGTETSSQEASPTSQLPTFSFPSVPSAGNFSSSRIWLASIVLSTVIHF